MKYAKWLLGVFLIVICFIGSGEIYQHYVESFTSNFYYIDIGASEYRLDAVDKLFDLSKKRELPFFSVERDVLTPFQYEINIYSTDDTKSYLSKKYLVNQGEKKSIFSGKTNLKYKELDLIKENNKITRFYFIGDKDDAVQLHDALNSYYGTSYVHKEESFGFEKLIIALWGVAAGFILILSWLDIQFQKKKAFLLVSLGKPMYKIVLTNIILDLCLFLGAFIISFKILDTQIFIEYRFKDVTIIGILFLIANSALYLNLFRYDYKEILYGANLNEKILNNAYVVKALSMILTVAVLSMNIMLIQENVNYLSYFKDVEEYREYGVLNISMDYSVFDEIGYENYAAVENSIFNKYYKEGKVLLANHTANTENRPVLLLNDNARIFEKDACDLIKKYPLSDIYIFLPKAESISSKDTDYLISTTVTYVLGVEKDFLDFQIIPYDKKDVLYFDFSESSPLKIGVEKIKDPIVVYCKLRNMDLVKSMDIGGSDLFENVFFKLSEADIKEIKKIDGIQAVHFQSIYDKCQEYKNVVIRTLILNTILSLILLIFEFVIIAAITKLEYIVNAKSLAIKKILGYSVLEKNKSILIINSFATLICVITMTIASLMYNLINLEMIMVVIVVLFSLEMLFIFFNIHKLEKSNISKILKGGSL